MPRGPLAGGGGFEIAETSDVWHRNIVVGDRSALTGSRNGQSPALSVDMIHGVNRGLSRVDVMLARTLDA